MDILEEIKKEHDEFKDLVLEIENAKGNKKKQLFQDLYAQTIGHHEAEEHVLFPDVKKNSNQEGKDVVMEMIEEHSLIAYQFSVVQKTSLENESWDAKFSVLKEILTHHLDEEEKDFFKVARKALDKASLTDKYNEFEETMKEYEEKQKQKLNNN